MLFLKPWKNKSDKQKQLTERAKALRYNQTKAERAFGRLAKEAWPDLTFKQQHIIGPYIVDFYQPDHKFVIEIDGGQHCESKADKKRDNYLKKNKCRVFRLPNNYVLQNKEGTYETINYYLELAKKPPPKKRSWKEKRELRKTAPIWHGTTIAAFFIIGTPLFSEITGYHEPIFDQIWIVAWGFLLGAFYGEIYHEMKDQFYNNL